MSNVGTECHWPGLPWRTRGPLKLTWKRWLVGEYIQWEWITGKFIDCITGKFIKKGFHTELLTETTCVYMCMYIYIFSYCDMGNQLAHVDWEGCGPHSPSNHHLRSICPWSLRSFISSSVKRGARFPPQWALAWTKWDNVCKGLSVLPHI